MVHRPSDSRLLTSLLSNEKEYHKQLLGLLDNSSQQSLGAFAAYASASPAPVAHAIIAVAGSFAGADDALRRYASSIEAWQAELRALKDLEDEVGNVIRDREILVTRLIKLSKNQKSTRDSFIGTLGSSVGEASQISLNSFTPPGPSPSKLGAAQSELHACEAHLAAKEKALDELRVSAVRRGLEARCKAMVECGWNWGEMGKEGLRALEGIDSSDSAPNGTDVSLQKRPPDPDRPPGSDLSSVGPSQSASQINLPATSLAVPTNQPTSTPPRVISPPPVGSRSSSPLPPMPSSSTVTLRIPPAHSISELALPSTTFERRISDVPEELEQEDSSEEDARHVEIVENPRFAASNTNVSRRFSLRTSHTRDNSGSVTTSSGTGTAPERERKSSGRFFSSIAGLFRGGGSIGSGHSSGTEKWKTRTQSNLQAVRRNADTDSEDDALTESPTRRIFGRRALRESPTPSSPAMPQKLRKRKGRQKEKDKDQGWISDGAAVGGRDARKASVKKRATLRDGSPRPASRPVPTSAPTRSSSEVFVGSSLMSGSRPSTPSPTKPGAKPKPKADVRVQTIARSSNTNVSRQTSMRSTGSVPPVPRRNATERAASLPPLQSTPGSAAVSRSSSLQHGRSRSVTHTSPPPLPAPAHPDVGRHGAGSGQMSLMSLVEGVTRNNRAAWDRANAGLPPEPAGSANKGGGLLSVRAPPSVTQYNLRGEGGTGISFESVLAPPSVFATPPPPPPATTTTITPSSSSASVSRRPISLPPPPRLPMPPTPPGAAPKVPLRSALRNQSPPPKPPPKPKPIVIPSAPPRVVVASPSSSPMPNGGDRGDEGSDSGSIASFRTVRETLSESSSPTPPHAPSPALKPALAPALASTSALAVPGQDESDVSTSTISANGGSGGGASGPTRRKSVRVSLQPTFSPTPPAIDEDEDAAWERSGRRRQHSSSSPPKRANGAAHYGDDEEDDGDDGRDDHARGKKGGRERDRDRDRERDFWADSSDEDEQYATARRMLTRAGKKRW